jgi:hypothetical protein
MEKATNALKSIGRFFSQKNQSERLSAPLPSKEELSINFPHKAICTQASPLNLQIQNICLRYPLNSWEAGINTAIFYLSCHECGISTQFDPNKK